MRAKGKKSGTARRTLSKAAKRKRVTASKIVGRSSRRDAVKKATSRVKTKAKVDSVRSLR